MSKDKKIKWEITFPEPFILDESISDKQIIDQIISGEEMSIVLGSALQPHLDSYVVECTENELIDALTNDVSDITIEIQQYDDISLIVVNDENNNLIGRGEITKASQKKPLSFIHDKFEEKMSTFKKKYDEGTKRMNLLTFNIKNLHNQYNKSEDNN